MKRPSKQSNATVTVATRQGELLALGNDKPITEALSLYGEWAQIEIEFLSQFLGGGAAILDVGSHVGVHACAFSLLAPSSTVHAFEPQPALYELLERNSAAIGKNIVTHRIAVGASEGRAFMPALTNDDSVNAGATKIEWTAVKGGVEIEVRALDSFAFDKVGFVKLDIEGLEAEALRGAAMLIRRHRPVVYCEVNSLESGVSVLETARSLDYEAYLVATPAFNPNNFRGLRDNIFGFANETGFLLQPRGAPSPDPKDTSLLRRVATIDDFAAAFLVVPRYGDKTPFDRGARTLAERLAALRSDAESEHKRNTDIAARLAAAETKVAEFGALEEALRVAEQKNAEMRLENDRLTSLNAATEASSRTTASENETLRRSLNQARADAVEARGALVEAQLRVAALSVELDAAKQSAAQSHDDAAAERHEGQALRTRLAALEVEAAGWATALSEKQREATERIEAVERRFETLRATLRNEREALAVLRAELLSERQANERVQAHVDQERARRRSLLELLGPTDVPSARKGSLGSLARRYARGKFAEALREIESSGLFDAAWYAKTYPDAVKDLHPASHYLLYGGDDFDPGPKFSGAGYLAANPDVRASGMNPLLHYVRWGARELRRWTSPDMGRPPAPTPPNMWSRPKAPSISFFRQLSEQAQSLQRTGDVVDVIVPVYRSYDDTLACLASVLVCQNTTPFELIVIDDCSPEPELSAALDELAQLGLITLLRNEANLGFVGTVNRGMSLHPKRDVVLLNSDTLVFNDWLDRICAHARERGKIATVTPFTNNGTICSYPRFCRDNKEAFDLPFDELDRLFGDVNANRSVEMPTGVGFCMYVSRACLSEIGLFDEETFGRGYGEENDFCMRASKRGWKNLHALDVFVFHSGETSFADSAHESKRRGLRLLHDKHPEYDGLVQSYVASDPARAARAAVDVAQLIGRAPMKATLCFSHVSGGGIDRYLFDYSRAQADLGRDVLLFVPSVPGTLAGRFTVAGPRASLPNLDGIDLAQDAEVLRNALALLNVDRIEIHSTVGWSAKAPLLMRRLADLCAVGYSVMIHDYVAICPQINLINESGRYCGEEGVAQCQRCLSLMKDQPRTIHPDISDPTRLNIVAWRKMHETLLEHAESVAAPSTDAAERVQRYFPNLKIAVVPHVEDLAHIPKLMTAPLSNQKIRVGVIGAIGPHKGSRVLLECARDALRRTLPIEFVVIGYTDIDRELEQAHVAITGRYDERDIARILSEQRVQVAFLPSVWPETFCYTLSIALAADIPICVFDLGAQAQRLRGHPRSLLLPIGLIDDPVQLNDKLIHFAAELAADGLDG